MSNHYKHENFSRYLGLIPPSSIFVEIGGDRGEGSTRYLSDLARHHGTDFYSVDIDDLSPGARLRQRWQQFYQNCRDPSWPFHSDSIHQLPEALQQECIHEHAWLDCQRDLESYWADCVPNTTFVTATGSVWSQHYDNDPALPISLLYLDNHDYVWNLEFMPDWLKSKMLTPADIQQHNTDCQIEHLAQLMNLYPWLTADCLVGLDDTYQQEDGCWLGKSGPGVVFLLSKGWQIRYYDKPFVILQNQLVSAC